MKDFIKNRLKEDLGYFGVNDSSPESDQFKMGVKEGVDKYAALEMDLRELMSKHQPRFQNYDGDSYGIIDALHEIMEDMFQKV